MESYFCSHFHFLFRRIQMRNNQPTTSHEVVMDDGMMIVPRTDSKGRIEFINKDFLKISGFAREELIGQPHNIIRHPDMPPEAFKDMWDDLKKGLPWSGYVKNRVKNGDHYWVYANAMPIMDGNQVNGFISIRSKPSRDSVKEVDRIYSGIREGKLKNCVINHGRVEDHSMKGNILRRFARISCKMTVMVTILCLMISFVGGTGIYLTQQIKDSLQTVYEDRTVAAGQLSAISRMMYVSAFDLNLISVGQSDPKLLTDDIEKNLSEIDKVWAVYLANQLRPEEKKLADQFSVEKSAFLNGFIKPALQLARSENPEERAQIQKLPRESLTKALDTNTQLIQFQLDEAQKEYGQSKAHNSIGRWISYATILMGFVTAFLTSEYIRKFILQRLNYLNSRLVVIMGGNYTAEIDVGDDELQPLLGTVRALQAKLAYNELEKKEVEQEKKKAQEDLARHFESEVGDIVSIISSAATELQGTAHSMTSTANTAHEQAQSVSVTADQTTQNIQTVASATEELTASIREIQNQISQSTMKIRESVEQADEANKKVVSLTEAAQKIGSVIDIISAIAEQTNLLALNATIEAARAGEAGKGFGVVAAEVKNLASQTGKATEEISLQIAQIQQKTAESVDSIQIISRLIGDINSVEAAIAAAIEEQGAATQEIARSVTEAAKGTQDVSSSISGLRAAAEETGTSSEEVLSAAGELARNGEILRSQVKTFLEHVRKD